ncbi:MAG: aminotransferase class I/II-fold pyridoxal phosphate-dependent enzyme [Cytophagaceae bacterium]
MNRIYLSPPYQDGNELRYVKDAIESNWIAPVGPFVFKFQQALNDYLKTDNIFLTSSGTHALHLALIGAGVSQGDVVICPTATFAGAVFPITYVGAEPVFVDNKLGSYTMDSQLLEKAILDSIQLNKKPKAVIAVHLYGFAANIFEIKRICDLYQISLIEDAAESLGTTINNQHCGMIGDFAIFSFNGNKIITAGGTGGALYCKARSRREYLEKLANQAKENTSHYEHREIGFNYRLSNINAAFGLAQLENLPQKIRKKRQIRDWYNEYLISSSKVVFSTYSDNDNAWLTLIEIDSKIDSELLRVFLEEFNIESRKLWMPMHLQPIFCDKKSYNNTVSELEFKNTLCLPSGLHLSRADVQYISEKINTFISRV